MTQDLSLVVSEIFKNMSEQEVVEGIQRQEIGFDGRFEIIDSDGNVKDTFDKSNVVPNEGLVYILNRIFGKGPSVTDFYIGLFVGNYTPVSTDTAATFPGSSSEFTAYTSTTRVAYQIPATITSTTVDNSASDSTVAKFVANASGAVRGSFLTSSPTKGGTDGILLSAIRFPEVKNLSVGDTLKVILTLTLISQ